MKEIGAAAGRRHGQVDGRSRTSGRVLPVYDADERAPRSGDR